MKVSGCQRANPAGGDIGPEVKAAADSPVGTWKAQATAVSSGEEVCFLLQLQEKSGDSKSESF